MPGILLYLSVRMQEVISDVEAFFSLGLGRKG